MICSECGGIIIFELNLVKISPSQLKKLKRDPEWPQVLACTEYIKAKRPDGN